MTKDLIKQEFENIVKSIDVISEFEITEKLRQYWTSELEKAGLKIQKIEIKRKVKKWEYYHQPQKA